MNSFLQDSSVVLVHGAWSDGSCWQKVILPLRQQGLRITAAQISLTSFADDVAALDRVLQRTNGPVVLVGHAYGGAVIAAAHDDRVKSLVYIAALAPDEGETVADVFFRADPHPDAPHLAPDAHSLIWMPEEGFRLAVAPRASLDQTTVMAAVQRPIAVKCIQERVPSPAWKRKPSWYLLAEEDRMIVPQTQRFMADRMGSTVRSCEVDHSPMLTAPDAVVELIMEAARQSLSK